jgi:hypothetical protein
MKDLPLHLIIFLKFIFFDSENLKKKLISSALIIPFLFEFLYFGVILQLLFDAFVLYNSANGTVDCNSPCSALLNCSSVKAQGCQINLKA